MCNYLISSNKRRASNKRRPLISASPLISAAILNAALIRITAQKMRFSIKNFFSKCDQIRSFLRVWSHLLKKSLTENLIFCAVNGH